MGVTGPLRAPTAVGVALETMARVVQRVRAPRAAARVLVVCGDSWLRWRLHHELERAGCRVTALPRLCPADVPEGEGYAVILADAALFPDGSRLEALHLLREQSPRTRFVLLVGATERSVAERARASGFDLVLPRPTCTEELPEVVAKVARELPHTVAPEASQSTILLVDDDAEFVAALARMLAYDGYVTIIATSSADALARLRDRDGAVDMVIADVDLSQENGLALLAELRRGWPALPIILLSASPDATTYLEALRLGAYEYLPKPLDFTELREVARRALHPVRRRP